MWQVKSAISDFETDGLLGLYWWCVLVPMRRQGPEGFETCRFLVVSQHHSTKFLSISRWATRPISSGAKPVDELTIFGIIRKAASLQTQIKTNYIKQKWTHSMHMINWDSPLNRWKRSLHTIFHQREATTTMGINMIFVIRPLRWPSRSWQATLEFSRPVWMMVSSMI